MDEMIRLRFKKKKERKIIIRNVEKKNNERRTKYIKERQDPQHVNRLCCKTCFAVDDTSLGLIDSHDNYIWYTLRTRTRT